MPTDASSENRQLASLSEAVAPTSAPPLSLAQDPEMVQEFLVESREHLASIEARVLELEQDASSQETLNGIFRGFHSIKGLAGFLDFAVIQDVSHEVETLLDKARNGELALTPSRVDVILASGDFIGAWLRHIERTAGGVDSKEPEGAVMLIERVRACLREDAADAGPPAGPASADPVAAALSTGTAASSVKVDTGKLEYLVDMVGELVIAQSMLRHNPGLEAVRTPRMQRDLAQLGRVTAEVQKTAMAMRMVPIGQLFRRMSRLVRDLARKSGKQAELEIVGEDVELDRTIVEQISDPLVHMLRNSMDHGIEPPKQREAAGKPRMGHVKLAASHEAGHIIIEIVDDGRGLDRARILKKAAERGLVDPGAALSDSEVFHLIFEAGFSTADKVTDVSGRGVGMDVVRRQVEKLRGRIEIDSTPGAGTRFRLKLPLTLAIIDGLVVLAGGERYILPMFAVREMFRPTADTVFTVEGKSEMALVRDRLLPVLRLTAQLGLTPAEIALAKDPREGVMIVGECEGQHFCLLVDELIGKQEVVIKGLGELFRNVRGVAGGAILGDGRVGLILDMAGLRKTAAAGVI